jgi:hypothetical protein
MEAHVLCNEYGAHMCDEADNETTWSSLVVATKSCSWEVLGIPINNQSYFTSLKLMTGRHTETLNSQFIVW